MITPRGGARPGQGARPGGKDGKGVDLDLLDLLDVCAEPAITRGPNRGLLTPSRGRVSTRALVGGDGLEHVALGRWEACGRQTGLSSSDARSLEAKTERSYVGCLEAKRYREEATLMRRGFVAPILGAFLVLALVMFPGSP